MGNYIKDIHIPRQWQGKRVYVRFNGASNEVNLFVNGRYAGEHKGGYTACTFEITRLLRLGEANNLWLRLNNSPQLDYMPINSDFNIYGGLYRDVELIVTEPVHFSLSDYGSDGVYIQQTRVTDNWAQVDAVVKLDGTTNGSYNVTIETVEPETGKVILERHEKIRITNGRGKGVIPLDIENPRLWNGTIDPYLYEFRFTLFDGDNKIDSLSLSVGLRYYHVDKENGFYLNGEPYSIRGVTRFQDRSHAGIAYTHRMHEEDMAIIREMGANAVRMTNFPQDPYFYSLCDRYGIIVWSELPFVGPDLLTDKGYIDKYSFRVNGKDQLCEMILQKYNHPSVFFWGLFSNLTSRGSDDPTEYIRELHALARQLDPTRPTIATSNQDGAINFITDMIGWTQYLGWHEGNTGDVDIWLGQLTRDWSQLKSCIGEYGAGGSINHLTDTLRRPLNRDRRHPERYQTHYHEQVYPIIKKYSSIWGSFVHSMFDFGAINYRRGDTPGVSDLGLVTYDRREKKDAFYFYKANWNTEEPFVHIAEKRWSERFRPLQQIRVFSNQDEIELHLNGVSLGVKEGENGTFIWDDVELRPGRNEIEAFSIFGKDRAEISIVDPNTIR